MRATVVAARGPAAAPAATFECTLIMRAGLDWRLSLVHRSLRGVDCRSGGEEKIRWAQ